MNRLFTTLLFFSCTFSLSAQQIVAKIQFNGTAEILPAEIPAQVSGEPLPKTGLANPIQQ